MATGRAAAASLLRRWGWCIASSIRFRANYLFISAQHGMKWNENNSFVLRLPRSKGETHNVIELKKKRGQEEPFSRRVNQVRHSRRGHNYIEVWQQQWGGAGGAATKEVLLVLIRQESRIWIVQEEEEVEGDRGGGGWRLQIMLWETEKYKFSIMWLHILV